MALRFSHLGSNKPAEEKSWNNIVLSPETVAHRAQLRQGMDDFTSFTWRGVDAFDVFGAFIINNKNTLKFYNGPTFSNEYTKPQFESAAGQLVGVSFGIQKIDFTIGVYWIKEDDYRKLIDWLSPYEINTLTFGFEPEYYYLVKLASIGDAIRHIVGIETTEKIEHGETIKVKEYQYYTEIKLTFEVQGDPCAYRKIAYEWKGESVDVTTNDNLLNSVFIYDYSLKDIDDNKFNSQLAMPFKYKMHLKLAGSGDRYYFPENLDTFPSLTLTNMLFKSNDINYIGMIISANNVYYMQDDENTLVYNRSTGWLNSKYRVIDVIRHTNSSQWDNLIKYITKIIFYKTHIEAFFKYLTFTNRLFYIDLQNLSIQDLMQEDDGYYLDIIYDSSTGLLYWDKGDSQLYLLSRLSTASTGSRLVDALVSTPYKVLGQFENWNFNLANAIIEVQVSTDMNTVNFELDKDVNFYIDMRARTNLI